MADVLRNISSPEAPLVLVFDDIQWADEGSLQLILHLAGSTSHLPLLIILAYRSEEAGPETRIYQYLQKIWSRANSSGLNLEPLSVDEIGALAFSMLGKRIPQVDEILKSQANGSPLFAIELLHAMVESGALVPTDSGWVVKDQDSLLSYNLNDGLATTIAKRFDRLEPEHRLLLQIASVAGRSFASHVIIEAARNSLGKKPRRLRAIIPPRDS